jgi:hypothetical protein
MVIDIGIACGKNQSNSWWGQVMPALVNIQKAGKVELGLVMAVGAALPDFAKTAMANITTRRLDLTDVNRDRIVELFSDTPSDAIWWIDDDTVPPPDALEKLIGLGTDVAAGVYFKRNPPCNPIAYLRNEQGGYQMIWKYQPGEIIHVDSVGMGCTLVRRHVYEEIVRKYMLFRRENYTLMPVHRDDFKVTRAFAKQIKRHTGEVLMDSHGDVVRIERLFGPVDRAEVELWPFYAMEYIRTEDHFFCELVKRLGMDIVLDTSIECQHWGQTPIVYQNFRDMRKWYEEEQKGAEGVRDNS